MTGNWQKKNISNNQEDYWKYGYTSTAVNDQPLPKREFCLAMPANEIKKPF